MSVSTITTDVELANLALDKVKEAPITDLSENRAAARWMNRNIGPITNMVMNAQIWKFAMERTVLSEDPTPPTFGWNHRHQKPADCFRVLPLRVNGLLNGRLIPHVVEGDYILSNVSGDLKVRYLKEVTDYSAWPVHFVNAVACKLAADIAHYLSGKQSMKETLDVDYQQALAFAASLDAAEGTHAEQVANDYADARYYHSGFEDGWQY
jgi:hypothetical protein